MIAGCLVLQILLFETIAQPKITGAISPKLRHFLTTHVEASRAIDQIILKAFTNRELQLYYFYSEDEGIARAFHYYPQTNAVVIVIRENQEPTDEFLCLLFEGLNSENEVRYQEICQDAQRKVISKSEFARQMIQVEFAALKQAQKIVEDLKLMDNEKNRSVMYKKIMNTPDRFEDFISNSKTIAGRDLIKEYELKYESLAP